MKLNGCKCLNEFKKLYEKERKLNSSIDDIEYDFLGVGLSKHYIPYGHITYKKLNKGKRVKENIYYTYCPLCGKKIIN